MNEVNALQLLWTRPWELDSRGRRPAQQRIVVRLELYEGLVLAHCGVVTGENVLRHFELYTPMTRG